jgi:hypothetical protein
MARGHQGRAAEGNAAANEALRLCRSCGDLYGAGNALNMLTFHEADLAVAMKRVNLALAEFEAAGYVERQAVVTSNLHRASRRDHRRARRLYLKASDISAPGAASPAATFPSRWPRRSAMGRLDSARTSPPNWPNQSALAVPRGRELATSRSRCAARGDTARQCVISVGESRTMISSLWKWMPDVGRTPIWRWRAARRLDRHVPRHRNAPRMTWRHRRNVTARRGGGTARRCRPTSGIGGARGR